MGDGDGLRRGEEFVSSVRMRIGHGHTVAYVSVSGQTDRRTYPYLVWVDTVCMVLYALVMTIEPASEFIPHITMGDRLRRIRRDLKLAQRDFSRELGVKESTYNAWETGRNAVADEVAIAKRIQLRWKIPAWWTLGIDAPAGPNGPDQGDECPQPGSNRRPADYKSVVLAFPTRELVAA